MSANVKNAWASANAADGSKGRPLVSVGIPTFDRPEGLSRTLACITGQTYPNLEILVSDNHSGDARVQDVCNQFRSVDSRVQLHRQQTNIGPMENFRFVLSKARGQYFMWAADDDTWEPQFVECLIELLERDPRIGVAFCNFDARYEDGARVASYPDFLPWLRSYVCQSTAERLRAYISQEERLGKANMIYGIFRKSELLAAGGVRLWGLGRWGADMLIVCSVLARADAAIAPTIMYHKNAGPASAGSPANSDVGANPRRYLRYLRAVANSLGSVAQHAGYALGYARIVSQATALVRRERHALYSLILRRFLILARRDLIGS